MRLIALASLVALALGLGACSSGPEGVIAGHIEDLDEITKTFQADMKAAYGYTLPTGYAPVEIVNLRVVAVGLITKPDLPKPEIRIRPRQR